MAIALCTSTEKKWHKTMLPLKKLNPNETHLSFYQPPPPKHSNALARISLLWGFGDSSPSPPASILSTLGFKEIYISRGNTTVRPRQRLHKSLLLSLSSSERMKEPQTIFVPSVVSVLAHCLLLDPFRSLLFHRNCF